MAGSRANRSGRCGSAGPGAKATRWRRGWRSKPSAAIAEPCAGSPSRALSAKSCDWVGKNRRLCVALWPTDAVRVQLAAAAEPYASFGRVIPARNLHITLVFLGAVAHERMAVVLEAAQSAQKLTF